MKRLLLVVTFVVASLTVSAHAQPPATLQQFLRDTIKLNDSDLASVEKGSVVTRLLPATDTGEIAAFGMVKIIATADQFDELARNPRKYYVMEGVDQIGLFSDPPAPADVQALAIPKDDIDALKKCRPGSCDVKLTDDALARIAEINWSAGDAAAQATKVWKQMMVEMATAYRSGGLQVLGTIMDKKDPKTRAGEFQRLLNNSPYLYKFVPAFQDYLKSYPSASFPGAKTTLYWTSDSFSPKQVVSMNASTVARIEQNVMIASQLLAASHFFNAGLDVCLAVPGQGVAELYLIDIYRVRIDPPTGMLAGPAMKKVEDGTVKGVEKRLTGIAARVK